MGLPRSLKKALLVSLCVAVLGFLALLLVKKDPGHLLTQKRHDFRAYYWWTRAYVATGNPYDAVELAKAETGLEVFPFAKHPPSMFLVLRPLTWLSEYPAQLVYYGLSGVAVVLYMGLCGYFARSPVVGTVVAYLWSAPFLSHALNLGQPTPFGCAALALSVYWMRSGRWIAAGVAMAIVSAFKPQEVLVFLPLALAGDRRTLVSAAVAFGVIVVLCVPFQGTPLWVEFFTLLPQSASGRVNLLPRHYLTFSTLLLAMSVDAMTRPLPDATDLGDESSAS